jgi:hypothetical protein
MDAVSPPVNKIQWYEKPLIMPLRDIIKEYREAKNPKKQIDILADLNHTKGCRIAWLLDRCGEAVDKVKLPRKSRDANAPDLDMIWRDTPLGVEAAQINMERKHRIMEEKTMNKETDTGCPVEAEENPLAWVEKALESEVSTEECPKNEDVVKEVALPPEREARSDKERATDKTALELMITAEFWQVYLSHTGFPIDASDVYKMLELSAIAKGLVR